MSYREVKVEIESRDAQPTLYIEMNPGTGALPPDHRYDLDYLGQDNGADPNADAALRLIMQLGHGYMIYLYVIGMAQPGDRRWFHNFWIKDCAVAYVDEDELGAPAAVQVEALQLPLVYSRVGIKAAAFAGWLGPHYDRPWLYLSGHIASCEFSAKTAASGETPFLKIEWRLATDAIFAWDNREYWSYTSPIGNRYVLAANDRVRFFK